MKKSFAVLLLLALLCQVLCLAEPIFECGHEESELVTYDVVDYSVDPELVSDVGRFHLKITQPMIASKCLNPTCGLLFSGRPNGESTSVEEAHTYDENGKCTICDYVHPDADHVAVVDPGVPATCTEDGLTEGSHCEICNKVLVAQTVAPMLGHARVTDDAVPATCTKDGLTEGSHCSRCGTVLVAQEVTPKLGHKVVVDKAVQPTLMKPGKTEGKHCKRCGKVLVKQKTVPRLINIKNAKVTGISDATFRGSYIRPVPTVKYGTKKLVRGTDYTVTYENNRNIGTATVIIRGKGKYGGTLKKTFKINPKKVSISKLTVGTSKMTVWWKKSPGGAGYQIQYGTDIKKISSAKIVTITHNETVKKLLKSLKSGKIYYVRIRGYKTIGNKKYVSDWSKFIKSQKIK